MRRLLVVSAAISLALSTFGFAPAPMLIDATPLDGVAPAAAASSTGERIATIVVFDRSVKDSRARTQQLLEPLGLRPFHIYTSALSGFAVEATEEQIAAFADDPDVSYVETDREVRTASQSLPTGVRRIDADHAAGIGQGKTVSVDIAIIDTGVASHSDLRVEQRLDCTDRSALLGVEYILFGCPTGGTDNDGHGTHVAGIAAARDNGSDVVGVAPGARIWAIKVINKTSGGSLADVIAGVDEVARRADTIEVANISLVASGTSSAMNDAVAGATDKGVVVVVAAGNESANASGTTPANSPKAITVSAVTDLDGIPGGKRSGTCYGGDDRFASYSNYGNVVDIAAPGSCILSTSRTGGTVKMSGTSMASPHVAGAAALRIAQRGLSASASRATTILNDLLSTSASEGSKCGYSGSPSNEKLLELVSGC